MPFLFRTFFRRVVISSNSRRRRIYSCCWSLFTRRYPSTEIILARDINWGDDMNRGREIDIGHPVTGSNSRSSNGFLGGCNTLQGCITYCVTSRTVGFKRIGIKPGCYAARQRVCGGVALGSEERAVTVVLPQAGMMMLSGM